MIYKLYDVALESVMIDRRIRNPDNVPITINGGELQSLVRCCGGSSQSHARRFSSPNVDYIYSAIRPYFTNIIAIPFDVNTGEVNFLGAVKLVEGDI
jgi:hypothetical protein